ncbi:hypothetical protein CHUAL_001767 [Chamberlinius hualienensis]
MVEVNSFSAKTKDKEEFSQAEDDQRQNQQHTNPRRLTERFDSQTERPFGGPPDFLDSVWRRVNQDLLVAKTFYFFFFSAFGSLFPLMAIFFKQLGMNPFQCGILNGFRPFVEFVSAPFWGTIADRYQKGKHILLFSLVCWIVFTLSLSFISPPASSCIYFNNTHHYLSDPDSGNDVIYVRKRNTEVKDFSENDFHWLIDTDISSNNVTFERWRRGKNKLPPGHVIGQSPGSVHYSVNYDPTKHSNYVHPAFSTIVYRREEVTKAFFLILLVVVIGEFFSAPAISLADSVTLTYLGENANNYGKQRMFGSLGWGITMFIVGIALDQSTVFPNHPCGPHERERNYTMCFAVFSVLMGCAFITATQFRFDYEPTDEEVGEVGSIQMKSMPEQNIKKPLDDPYNTESQAPEEPPEPKPEKSTVFASKAKQIPEWFRVLRTFANLRYGSFLFVAWFMGMGVGLVFTFLFWHLQDMGGSPTLFGIASVINHVSEICAYFFCFRLIRQIGHVRVLCLGLVGNLARFLYVSWLTKPWWVLPFEFIQGITHASVWAACCSYITQATPINLRCSAQGVLQGLHHGFGRGCGAVFGGLIATYFGTAIMFRVYGFLCLIVLVTFIFINYYQPDRGFASAESVEPHQVLEETAHLAPHGVPSGHMPRALSSSRLQDMDQAYQGYGSATGDKQNGPFLGVPNSGGAWTQNENDKNNYGNNNRSQYKDDRNRSNGVMDHGHSILNAPPPPTVHHAPQPTNQGNPSTYDW